MLAETTRRGRRLGANAARRGPAVVVAVMLQAIILVGVMSFELGSEAGGAAETLLSWARAPGSANRNQPIYDFYFCSHNQGRCDTCRIASRVLLGPPYRSPPRM